MVIPQSSVLKWRWGRNLLLAACLGVLAGCSSFHGDFRREVAQAKALASTTPGQITPSIEGAWEGRWISEVNGHKGRLRCLLTKSTNDTFQARFHATYARLLTFGYTVPLRMSGPPETRRFEGEANLGKLAGGLYSYSGTVTFTNLTSTYSSKMDHGRFEMKRP